MRSALNFPTCRFLQNKVGTVLRSPRPYILDFSFNKLPFNSLKSCIPESSRKTINADHLPTEYREPYILKGYRSSTDFLGSLHSLFWLHNESFNCWSHILGIPMVLSFFAEEYITSSSPLMYLYLFSCLCFVLGSSFAHTFCCYSRLSRDAYFTVDYIGLTIFTCGSGAAYVAFSFPIELSTIPGVSTFSFLDTYLIFLCLCSMVSIFQSVWTRTLSPSVLRSVLRVSAFAAPGIIMSFPILYKIYACYCGANTYPPHYCDSAVIWPKQFLTCIISIIFYVSRFPEYFYPGKFDYFGHSHNVFHIGALLGLHYQKLALSLDLEFAKAHQIAKVSLKIPLFGLSFLFIVIFLTCIYFRHLFAAKPSYKSRRL
uniref:Membrane progestin receptor gamma n=1 Tax=Echinococcus granulosus TaxID=6210 RepID=A0A068WFP0_ECHGR|nr:membrane progestin receptor gamma [Echinococcus granulosus]